MDQEDYDDKDLQDLQEESLPFDDSIPEHEIRFVDAEGVVFVSCTDVADLLVMIDPDDEHWYSKIQDLAFQLENIQLN